MAEWVVWLGTAQEVTVKAQWRDLTQPAGYWKSSLNMMLEWKDK